MDRRVQELIDFTHSKLGLENYFLQTHRLERKINLLNETVYTLSMEWFPKDATEVEEGINPEGTASVELRIDNRKFESIIFVGEKSFATGLTFSGITKEKVISWVEQEFGLTGEKQLKLNLKNEREFTFRQLFDGIKISPSSYIEIKFDQDGRLIFYSAHGPLSSENHFQKEEFSLNLDEIEEIANVQLKRLEMPSFEKSLVVPIYGIEEIYIRNDQSCTYPFELFRKNASSSEINERMEWDTPLDRVYDRQEIQFFEDLSPDEAFSFVGHPDLKPINEDEKLKAMAAVKDFLRSVYPDDSGKWILITLHRENGYVHATLRQVKYEGQVFKRKLLVFLDSNMQVVNFIDNSMMTDMMKDFERDGEVTISHEEAFAKIRLYLELKPVYVYDTDLGQFKLCGKLDCDEGIHAGSGEVISLGDI